MMRLDEIINYRFTIPRNQIVSQLDQLLNSADITVSSWGTRLVSIQGYEGTVELDKIAYVYVRAEAFMNASAWPSDKKSSPSLEERMSCYNLGKRIIQLYKDSELLNTSGICNFCLTYLNDLMTPCLEKDARTHVLLMESKPEKNSLFQFSPEEFRKYWPNENAIKGYLYIDYTDSCGNGPSFERWVANETMIQSALNKKIE